MKLPAVLLALVAVPLAMGGPLFKGMSLVSYEATILKSATCDQSIANMQAIGVDTVAINVFEFQQSKTSTVIAPDYEEYSSTGASLRTAIRRVKARGMRVMLKPIVDLKNGNWRGEIPSSAAWFAAYKGFINRYADIAQQEGVDLLSVGCEYSANQDNEAAWRSVVAGVRARYKGRLTYAANYDAFDLKWWDAVDYVGIDAYFGLSARLKPSYEELVLAWRGLADQLAAWRLLKAPTKKILFTEIGYRNIDGGAIEPWDWNRTGPINMQLQSDCYRALLGVMWRKSWWGGAFWWEWQPRAYGGGASDDRFTPQHKPAQNVVEWYYRFAG